MKSCYTRYKSNGVVKKKQEKKETKLTQEKEYGLILSNVFENYVKPIKKEKWIEDSGATVHITNNDFGMF